MVSGQIKLAKWNYLFWIPCGSILDAYTSIVPYSYTWRKRTEWIKNYVKFWAKKNLSFIETNSTEISACILSWIPCWTFQMWEKKVLRFLFKSNLDLVRNVIIIPVNFFYCGILFGQHVTQYKAYPAQDNTFISDTAQHMIFTYRFMTEIKLIKIIYITILP